MSFKVASEIGRRLAEKIEQDETRTRCGRVDMQLADYNMLSPNEARIMVAYSKERGTPMASQLDEWITASSRGRFLLTPETVRDHRDLGAFVGIVREVNTPAPIQKAASMVPVGANRFAAADGSHWERNRTAEGEEYLLRVQTDDMGAILEEMKQRRAQNRFAAVDLSMVRTAGVANLEVGDEVAYATQDGGQVVQYGKVSKVGTNGEVSVGNDANVMVIEITKKNAGSLAKQNRYLTDFWKEHLFAGKDFGKGMKIDQ